MRARRGGGGARAWHAGAAGAAGAAALVLLAGCGVPTTGVIDVGVPVDGLPSGPAALRVVPVYFLDADGRLQAAEHTVPDGSEPEAAAVDLLLAGPAAAGRPDLTTHLPRSPVAPAVGVRGRTVTVALPAPVPRLDALAMEQLACTASEAWPAAVPAAVSPFPGAASPGPGRQPVRIDVTAPGWHLTRTSPSCPRPTASPSAASGGVT
ncbi:GerMN domain-containing protein [Actinacidiphila reveromycinica]|uniref:GerMN domain-containing protein n=1 Tax=Actinacidiphila reveromycinica TaxID=659352 RepID=UPI0019239856|nr:GerMN domain-containing protein [Streptomyces sp. SN-593]